MSQHPFVFLALGTRGDIQPMVALSLRLRASGQPVRLAAPPAFGDWITSFGLPFAPLEGNPSDLLTAPGGQSALTFDGNAVRSLSASLRFLRRARPLYARMLASAAEACRNARALVVGLPTVWGVHLAEWLGVPCLGAFTQPVTPTGEFFSPLVPAAFNWGRVGNRLSHHLAAQAVFLPWRGVINDWRKQHGLLHLTFFDFTSRLSALVYGFSHHVVPPPADWPPHVHLTGYWVLPPARAGQFTPPALEAFLSDGPPPLYVTFGSPGALQQKRMLDIITQSLSQTGLRAIVALPEGFSLAAPRPGLFPLSAPVPHPWLFPRLGGVIHHGGAGTTAAGLMAGLPALVLPLAVDQFFWGQRVHALGVGPRPIPQRALDVNRLTEALAQMQEPRLKATAANLAYKLSMEYGDWQAVEILQRVV